MQSHRKQYRVFFMAYLQRWPRRCVHVSSFPRAESSSELQRVKVDSV